MRVFVCLVCLNDCGIEGCGFGSCDFFFFIVGGGCDVEIMYVYSFVCYC